MANVQSVLSVQNADLPKGQLTNGRITTDILANDQIFHAEDYKPLIIGYSNGAAVHLSDVAQVTDSVQNIRAGGYLNGKRAVTLIIFREPGANIINTVNRLRAQIPWIKASIPEGIDVTVVLDRTTTIRASVEDVERTLLFSVVLVIVVVFVFLRNPRATLIPGVAVPVSLIGTCAVMYLFGYSIDNLSLMALTISTGFVVDDAIVVMENITRYLEEGLPPLFKQRSKVLSNRVHRFLDQHFPDRGLHPSLGHGRNRRPVISRVRGYAVDRHPRFHGHLVDHHAHDVRLYSPK